MNSLAENNGNCSCYNSSAVIDKYRGNATICGTRGMELAQQAGMPTTWEDYGPIVSNASNCLATPPGLRTVPAPAGIDDYSRPSHNHKAKKESPILRGQRRSALENKRAGSLKKSSRKLPMQVRILSSPINKSECAAWYRRDETVAIAPKSERIYPQGFRVRNCALMSKVGVRRGVLGVAETTVSVDLGLRVGDVACRPKGAKSGVVSRTWGILPHSLTNLSGHLIGLIENPKTRLSMAIRVPAYYNSSAQAAIVEKASKRMSGALVGRVGDSTLCAI